MIENPAKSNLYKKIANTNCNYKYTVVAAKGIVIVNSGSAFQLLPESLSRTRLLNLTKFKEIMAV